MAHFVVSDGTIHSRRTEAVSALAIGLVAWLLAFGAGGLWYYMAAREWTSRAVRDGKLPEHAPDGLMDRVRSGSPGASLEMLRRAPELTREGMTVQFTRDSDPETEQWRLRMNRRLAVIVGVLTTGWIVVPLAWLVGEWLSVLLLASPLPVWLAFVAVVTGILGYTLGRLITALRQYEGTGRLRRRVIFQTVASVAVIAMVLLGQLALLR